MLHLTLALLCSLTPSNQPASMEDHVIIEVLSSARTVKGTLSIPSVFEKNDSGAKCRITLKNLSGKPVEVYDAIWAAGCVSGITVKGSGLPAVNGLRIVVPLPHKHRVKLQPGRAIIGDIWLDLLWSFEHAKDGEYRVTIRFDDSSYWPEAERSKRLGQIDFPLSFTIRNGHVAVSER